MLLPNINFKGFKIAAKDACISDNLTCAILHTDICIRCSNINVIAARYILCTKSSNSGHINTKDNTWQDRKTRDRH
jgi:hypothetical protein